VFNTERASLLQVASVASFKKAISSVQGRFCANSNSEKSDPKLLSEQPSITSGRSSVSNIRVKKLRIVQVCIRSDVMATCLDAL
jgi:hypothetical protein